MALNHHDDQWWLILEYIKLSTPKPPRSMDDFSRPRMDRAWFHSPSAVSDQHDTLLPGPGETKGRGLEVQAWDGLVWEWCIPHWFSNWIVPDPLVSLPLWHWFSSIGFDENQWIWEYFQTHIMFPQLSIGCSSCGGFLKLGNIGVPPKGIIQSSWLMT